MHDVEAREEGCKMWFKKGKLFIKLFCSTAAAVVYGAYNVHAIDGDGYIFWTSMRDNTTAEYSNFVSFSCEEQYVSLKRPKKLLERQMVLQKNFPLNRNLMVH
jgi:hypothetical protein